MGGGPAYSIPPSLATFHSYSYSDDPHNKKNWTGRSSTRECIKQDTLFTMRFDRRKISYRLYGDTGSSAPPIVFFHGTGLDSYQARDLYYAAAQMSLKIIAIDRPGLGDTTHDPNRRVADFHKYLGTVLQRLKVKEFYMLAASGGAAYLLSSLRFFTAHRVLGAAIVAGQPPRHILKPHIGSIEAPRPSTIRRIIKAAMPSAYLMTRVVDRPRLTNPEGVHLDRKVIRKDWGFSLDDVHYEGIQMWYSHDDQVTPLAAGIEFSEKLDRANVFKVYSRAGHDEILTYCAEDILYWLCKERHGTRGSRRSRRRAA